MKKNVHGGEGLLIHGNNVVLGIQKKKRWYSLNNKKYGAIIKTIGGSIEKEDKRSYKRALVREIFEEISNLEENDLNISYRCIFEKHIKMSDYNPFDSNFDMSMNAKFYLVSLNENKKIFSNDLPFLLEIPIIDFIKMNFNTIMKFDAIKKYVINNDTYEYPEYISLFVPDEVKDYLSKNEA